MKPDLIVCADTVHTMDDRRGITAVAMEEDRIVALGGRVDVGDWRAPGTEVIDLGGATLVPGLTDCHVHPVLGARMTRGVGLLEVASLDGLRAAVGTAAAELPSGAWVLGWGLDPNVVPGGRFTREMIDDVLGGRPAILRLFDGHSALASSRALEMAGVTGARSFDQTSQIVCDESGVPTGLLLEQAAMSTVDVVLPVLDTVTLAGLVGEALHAMATVGITNAHALEHEDVADAVYSHLEDRGDLAVRLRCSPWCLPGTGERDWARLGAAQGEGGRRWTQRGVKLFVDGTVDNGTAWLSAPDLHGQSVASHWPDPADYSRAVQWFAARGIPTATHAIGDRAVRHVLDALDVVVQLEGTSAARHRVEHIETVTDDLVGRFARSGLTASMQPTHATDYTRADGSDNWSTRLGAARAAQGWRTRDLRDAGVHVALGSDWPVVDCDPRGVLAAARLRRRGGRPDRDAVQPGQRLTARMALEGYTTHAAWSVSEEAVAGTITVGKRADLTAFCVDPLEAPADELAEAPIALTVLDGSVTHRLADGG